MVAVRHTMASEPCLAYIAKIRQFRNYTNSRAISAPQNTPRKISIRSATAERKNSLITGKSRISRRDIIYHS